MRIKRMAFVSRELIINSEFGFHLMYFSMIVF